MSRYSLLMALIAAILAQFGTDGAAQPSAYLRLANVRILELTGVQARLSTPVLIEIEGARIIAIRAYEKTRTNDDETPVIDGAGRVVMAGLTDMHVHIWDEAALTAYLGSGVTTVRNASGMPFHLRLAERIERGDLLGTRLVTTGPILNSPGPNQQINHELVSTREEARAAVRRQYAAGFRILKVYSNLTREAYTGLRIEAQRLGMAVTGHTPEGVRVPGVPHSVPFRIPFEEVLADRWQSIEHVESIVWHGLRDVRDESAGRLLARRIAAAGVLVDPTLLAFYNLLRTAETGGAYLNRPGTEMLNPVLVAYSKAEYERWANEDAVAAGASFAFYKQMTRMLAEEGVTLVAGSDAGIFTNVPGNSLIEELRLLHEAGISTADVLRAATINAAAALGDPPGSGTVRAGNRADLLILDANPLRDLSTLGNPYAVIAAGRLMDRAALSRLRNMAAQHDPVRTRRHLREALEAQGASVEADGR